MFLKPRLHLLNNNLLKPKEREIELTKILKAKYCDPATAELSDVVSLVDPPIPDNLHRTLQGRQRKRESCYRAIVMLG